MRTHLPHLECDPILTSHKNPLQKRYLHHPSQYHQLAFNYGTLNEMYSRYNKNNFEKFSRKTSAEIPNL